MHFVCRIRNVLNKSCLISKFQTLADKEKEDSYRHSAMEVMVSLCETIPGAVRKKAASFIPALREYLNSNFGGF